MGVAVEDTPPARDFHSVVRLFMDRYLYDEEYPQRIFTFRSKFGPYCEIVQASRGTVYGVEHTSYFVSLTPKWNEKYGDDFADPKSRIGISLLWDAVERAGHVERSLFAVWVDSDQLFYGISGRKLYNYVRAYRRMRQAPWERAGCMETGSPRSMWKELFADTKLRMLI